MTKQACLYAIIALSVLNLYSVRGPSNKKKKERLHNGVKKELRYFSKKHPRPADTSLNQPEDNSMEIETFDTPPPPPPGCMSHSYQAPPSSPQNMPPSYVETTHTLSPTEYQALMILLNGETYK